MSALFKSKSPKIMRDLLRDFPVLGVEDAAAILGNIGGETGGFKLMQELKPLVKGSRGGWGWAQWTGPRRRAFEAWAKKNKLDPASDAANYGYLVLELRGDEKKALTALRKAQTLPDKVVAFERTFERAGIPHHASRIHWANIALKAYYDSLPKPEPEPPAYPDTKYIPHPPPDVEPVDPKPVEKAKSLQQRIIDFLAGGGVGALGALNDWKIVLAIGGVVIVGGLVWYLIQKRRRAK